MSDVRDISAGIEPTAGRRWRLAPVLRFSAAFHLGGLATIAIDPLS